MNTETLVEPDLVTSGRLHLFSLYVDFPAAVRARWATRQISRLAEEQWKVSTEMWNLDSLTTSEPIRKMITRDVADADVLVIATSSLDWRELELVQWLDSLTAGKANRPGPRLFIGLLGDGRGQAVELDWTVKEFLRCARQMGRDFIWHWMDRDAMVDDDWLTDSVEVPLNRKQPGRNAIFLQEAAIEVLPETSHLLSLESSSMTSRPSAQFCPGQHEHHQRDGAGDGQARQQGETQGAHFAPALIRLQTREEQLSKI